MYVILPHLQQAKKTVGQTAAEASAIWFQLKLFYHSILN